MPERYINWLPLTRPQPGTWPATQACALTGNQTSDLSVHRLVLNPLSHTTQGLTIFNVPFRGIKYTYIVVQPSPSSISRTFSPSHTESLSPLNTNSHSPRPAPCTHHLLPVSESDSGDLL